MRTDLARQRERDLADLEQRVAVAQKLASSDAKQAATVYQAIIDLYGDDAWAAAVVTKARNGLAELKK